MRVFVLIVFFLFTVSCSYHEVALFNQSDSYSSNVTDYTVGYNAIKHLFSRTKGSSIEIIPYEKNADTLFYVVNTNEGWQIISNDQRATPILAMGYDEKLNPKTTVHKGIKVWLEAASDYITSIRKMPLNEEQINNIKYWQSTHVLPLRDSIDNGNYRWMLVESTQQTGSYIANNVPHLINTKWGQYTPWNDELPILYNYPFNGYYYTGQCPTGCVAVAISQLLYYWHHNFGYPNSLYHTVNVSGTQQYIEAIQSNLIINTSDYVNSSRWDDMPLTASGPHCDYVGDLMLYIGKRVFMHYTPIGSGSRVYFYNFEENGMACSQSSYVYSTVSNCLDNNKPIIVEAWPYNSNEGHAWIIDGKVSHIYTYTTTSTWHELDDGNIHGEIPEGTYYYTEEQALAIDPNVYDGKTSYSYSSTTNNYLRMNWGLEGEFDNAEYSACVAWHPVNNNGGSNNMPTLNTNAVIYYNFTTHSK